MDSRPPRAVADLLLTAVPDLRDRLLEHRIRRAWPQVVGADAARRAQARSFADAARRLLTKAWPGLTVIVMATALMGCASMGGPTVASDDEIPIRAAAADPRADAYYSYSMAQMYVQAGRFKDAVPFMRTAIK